VAGQRAKATLRDNYNTLTKIVPKTFTFPA